MTYAEKYMETPLSAIPAALAAVKERLAYWKNELETTKSYSPSKYTIGSIIYSIKEEIKYLESLLK